MHRVSLCFSMHTVLVSSAQTYCFYCSACVVHQPTPQPQGTKNTRMQSSIILVNLLTCSCDEVPILRVPGFTPITVHQSSSTRPSIISFTTHSSGTASRDTSSKGGAFAKLTQSHHIPNHAQNNSAWKAKTVMARTLHILGGVPIAYVIACPDHNSCLVCLHPVCLCLCVCP